MTIAFCAYDIRLIGMGIDEVSRFGLVGNGRRWLRGVVSPLRRGCAVFVSENGIQSFRESSE